MSNSETAIRQRHDRMIELAIRRTTAKEMILDTLEAKGGIKYLERIADEKPTAFLSLLGTVLKEDNKQQVTNFHLKDPKVMGDLYAAINKVKAEQGKQTIDVPTVIDAEPVDDGGGMSREDVMDMRAETAREDDDD